MGVEGLKVGRRGALEQGNGEVAAEPYEAVLVEGVQKQVASFYHGKE